jgi:glycosyltransferase involved in cell wall biosynthesis
MAPDDVFVVRNGPDLDEEAPTLDRDLHRGHQHLVVFAGSIESQDGVGNLVDAAQRLLDDGRDVAFVIAGPGGELDAVRQRAVALGIADRMTFTGRIPHEEVLGIIGQADVCVSPDGKNPLNDRSTMVKVLEYMAAGKPVAQFDLHEGHVSAGNAALYATSDDPIDLAAKIGRLLDDPGLRQRLGHLGRRRIETDLAWQHQVPQLLAAYARLDNRQVATSPSVMKEDIP